MNISTSPVHITREMEAGRGDSYLDEEIRLRNLVQSHQADLEAAHSRLAVYANSLELAAWKRQASGFSCPFLAWFLSSFFVFSLQVPLLV